MVTVNSIQLNDLTPRQLKALARKAMAQAEKKLQKPVELKPTDPRLAPLGEALTQANQALGLKSVATLNLLARRFKLGHILTPHVHSAKTAESITEPVAKKAATVVKKAPVKARKTVAKTRASK